MKWPQRRALDEIVRAEDLAALAKNQHDQGWGKAATLSAQLAQVHATLAVAYSNMEE